ncbi:hypothetical protein FRB93_008145 [Tulasnella sp. JGI-2019a]|nr:hypothetical protein FRB93_008145 [Tulasnella sp. JGI-2019a]
MSYRSPHVDLLEGFARLGLNQSESQYPHHQSEVDMSSWIVPPQEVAVDDEMPLGGGNGSHTTFRGSWNGMVVAVKRLPPDSNRQVILNHVRRYRSPSCANVLQVLGASSEAADPPYIISPFLANGSITEYLARYPGASRPKAVAEVALGMEYLHSMNVEHGRLKTSNVLVTENGQACIVDQGLFCIENMPVSSYRYLSPEAWKGAVSKPSDVFSFAVVAYEISTSVIPWGYLSENQVFKLVVRLQERPERNPPDALPLTDREWLTLEDGWHVDPDARPTFKQIVARLNARAFEAGSRESSGSILLGRGTPTPALSSNNSVSYQRRPLPATELDGNMQSPNIPPAPPAYGPNDEITTFRPFPSGPMEKAGLRPSPEVAPSRASQRSSPTRWDGSSASQYQEPMRSPPSGGYNGRNQQPRPPSAASASDSGSYGGQGIGRPPLPPESVRMSPSTDRDRLPSMQTFPRGRDNPGRQSTMDYLTRQYSVYDPSSASHGTGLPHQLGLDLNRVSTAFSAADSFASSQSPGPGSSSYHRERFESSASSSFGTTPAATSAHSHYFSGMVIPETGEPIRQWSPRPPQQEVPYFQPSTRRFSQVDFGWHTVFYSSNHRIPVYAETWFKKDWEVAEIHENHCLFKRKSTDKHLVNVYSMRNKKLTVFDLKSEPMAVGLSYDGRYLISSLATSINIVDVETHKVTKRGNNHGVRQWASNRNEFCWVDREGVFVTWSFTGEDHPRQVFRLKSDAPSASMRPMTTDDGSWYAICATDRGRLNGVVHCYPANSGAAQVFDGVSAGFVEVEGVGGVKIQALATLKNVSEGGRNFFEMQIHYLGNRFGVLVGGMSAAQPRRYPNEAVGKSLPRLWDDPRHSMVVAAVAKPEGYFVYVFESATGDLLCTHPIDEQGYNRVYCGSGGLFVEDEGRAIKKLQLHPGGLMLDTSPVIMPLVQSPTMTLQSEPLSSPSTTTLPPPQMPSPPHEYGRVEPVDPRFSDTSSEKKSGGLLGRIKSIASGAGRPDRIVSSSSQPNRRHTTKSKENGYYGFGQGLGDEQWLYEKRK